MLFVTLDDIHTLTQIQNSDNSTKVLIDAIKRNSEYKDYNFDFLYTKEIHYTVEPKNKKLRKLIKNPTKDKVDVILSFNEPKETFLSKNPPFTHFFARGEYFPFKKSDIELGVSEEKVLQDRLGFSMKQPRFGFESVAGAFNLKARIERIKLLMQFGIKKVASAFFMFGTAGSGKTYSAEAIAYELGMKFGYLDLPHFMTLSSPTRALDELFDYLQMQDTPCLLLIDEIEKMFDFDGNDLQSKNVFGKLLTRLNDIYNDENNKILFIATANDISKIVKNSPEFLRKGRFNELFFAGYPKRDGAIEIIEMYLRKSKKLIGTILSDIYTQWLHTPTLWQENQFLGLKLLFNKVKQGDINPETQKPLTLDDIKEKMTITLEASELYEVIDNAYPDELKVSKANECIYSPPEIKAFIEELQYKCVYDILCVMDNIVTEKQEIFDIDLIPNADDKVYEANFLKNHSREIIPLQMSAREGIARQIAQAKFYNNNTKDTYELYTSTE